MSRLRCAFFLLFLASAPAFAGKAAELQACASASDCSVIQAPCPGHFEAVNAKFSKSEEAENLKTRMIIKCDAQIPPKYTPKAICVDAQCALAPEEK